MNLLIVFLTVSFLLGLFLWNRPKRWRTFILVILCLLLTYGYYAYLSLM